MESQELFEKWLVGFCGIKKFIEAKVQGGEDAG